jgi:hypothetical protein
MHGHSRARKVFFYGNNYVHDKDITRIFPYLLESIAPNYFNFDKCRFKVEKTRKGTSRIALWRIVKAPAVYTLEASLCGAAINSAMPHFTSIDL